MTEPTHVVVIGDGYVRGNVTRTNVRRRLRHLVDRRDLATCTTRSTTHRTSSSASGASASTRTSRTSPVARTREPHITVRGTGDGGVDVYGFTSPRRCCRARRRRSCPFKASFDIDRGYRDGDAIVWYSLLKLYNSTGDLLARGPGGANPTARRRSGSSTATTTTSPTPSQRRASTSSRSAAPSSAAACRSASTTSCRSSIEQAPRGRLRLHAVAGVRKRGRPDAALQYQQLVAANFFKLFDPTVGGDGTDSFTPYARIQGSGDGTFDVFRFEVTDGMLNPPALGQRRRRPRIVGGRHDAVLQDCRAQADRRRSRPATAGRWASATATTRTPAQAATACARSPWASRRCYPSASRRPSPTTGDVVLTITDPNGFNLHGVKPRALSRRSLPRRR